MRGASTVYFLKIRIRSSFSSSSPIEIHVSVMITSASFTACSGSRTRVTSPPRDRAFLTISRAGHNLPVYNHDFEAVRTVARMRELQTLLPSPTQATLMSFVDPKCSWMVMMSARMAGMFEIREAVDDRDRGIFCVLSMVLCL